MLHDIIHWIRTEAQAGPRGRLARWIGRNWARVQYALHVEPTWLEVVRHEIPIADLPAGFEGFRIVQLSDFHGSRQVTSAYLDEAVALAQAQRGDLLVLTGDFIHKGFRHIDRVASALGNLTAPQGIFAVLGNHDYSVRNSLGYRRHQHLHRAVADALTTRGIRVLHNESIPLIRDSQRVILTGVADLWSRTCDPARAFADLPPNLPRIVLAHNPWTLEHLRPYRFDLILSGHTHGGQVRLPGLGPLALGPKGRKYAAGLYDLGGRFLYVNKGVGFGLPVRYRVRPEVAVFTLRRQGTSM